MNSPRERFTRKEKRKLIGENCIIDSLLCYFKLMGYSSHAFAGTVVL